MKQTIQGIRERLKEAGRKEFSLRVVTGCCRIHIDGSTATKSGITEQDCREITNDYPGATYTFTPGRNCIDSTPG